MHITKRIPTLEVESYQRYAAIVLKPWRGESGIRAQLLNIRKKTGDGVRNRRRREIITYIECCFSSFYLRHTFADFACDKISDLLNR
jgi:hypothetical protein